MILVTLGTQDKTFIRLLEKIDDLIEKGLIKDQVVVQSGYTKYHSSNMEIFDLIPQDEFNSLMDAAKFFAKDDKHAKNIRSVIWQCVHNIDNHKTYKGLIWAYTN